jgi:hypothetical protein
MERCITAICFLFAALFICRSARAQASPDCNSAWTRQTADQDHEQYDDVLYPDVHASYLGGTIPAISGTLTKQHQALPFGLGGVEAYQYRKSGFLMTHRCYIFFAFKTKERTFLGFDGPKVANSSAQMAVGDCESLKDSLQATMQKPCGDLNKESCGHWHILQIPYDGVNLLSRATKLASDQAADRTAFLAAAAALLTAAIGTGSNEHAKLEYGGVAIGAAIVAYYFLIARPSRHENYMAFFFGKRCTPPAQSTPPQLKPTSHRFSQPPKADDNTCSSQGDFRIGDVAIFKIQNGHDYYNIGLILSGKTGLQFVSETDDKGAAPGK